MADLIAITFESHNEAQEARRRFAAMSHHHLVELEDSVIAYKNDRGKVKLDQTVNLTAAGAANGGMWGLLIGLLFSIPTGAALLPIASTAVGAAVSALGAQMHDYGINDDLMKRLANDIESGKATLFILARNVRADKMMEELAPLEGHVLCTSLPNDIEERLQIALKSAA